jgi:hypothetical protein
MKKAALSVFLLSLALAACGTPPTVTPTDEEKVREYSTVKQTGKDQEDPVHGKQVGFWYGAVGGIGDVNANGVGFLRQYEDGLFSLTVNLNILKSETPSVYAAWVTNDDGSKSVFAGVLSSIVGDARHSASLDTKEDLTGLTRVLVTKESVLTPTEPGPDRVAEGTMRAVNR